MTATNILLTLNQALIGQVDRLLKLSSPLGEDVLLPQRVIGSERLGRVYDYTIDTISVRSDIELKSLIAQPVTLWIRQMDRSYSPVHGYIHTAKRLGGDGQVVFCQISFAPWLHFLKFRKDARIWQEKTPDAILTDVFNGHPQARGKFRFDLRASALTRSYCTQYETDWNFVQRLMEEEGWYSYHEQLADGSGHRLVITDTSNRLKPVNPQQIYFHGAGSSDEINKIVQWSAERTLGAKQFTAQTDDYKSPNIPKQSTTSIFPEHGNIPKQLEIYEYAGAYAYSTLDQGNKQVRVQIEGWESRMKRFHGISGVRSLSVGSWFTLEDHPAHRNDSDEDREFMVIGIDWCIENNLPLPDNFDNSPNNLSGQVLAFKDAIGRRHQHGHGNQEGISGNKGTGHCFNRFEVQRRKVPFRSPADHVKPQIYPQTAVVVGPAGEEIYTDHLNRVKIQFRWERERPANENASCWVRVSYPNAGQGWGAINVPRIGQEVIVTFLNGDPDRPIITGRLYNEVQVPQWHTNGQLSGYKSKEYRGQGFSQLVFDDTTNQNRVQLYSTNSHAQLNLGYLVTQHGNERGRFYGAGFALSTDAYGAIVTQKGLYISTFGPGGADGTQLDVAKAAGQLKAGAVLVKTLSDAGTKSGAEPLASLEALNDFIDATKESYADDRQKEANRFKDSILVAASSSGIGLTSVKGTHVHAGGDVTLSSGMSTNIATGKSLLASVAEKIGLFAANAGIKLFAAKGKIEVQAQSDDLDLIAEKVVRLLSTAGRIEIHAKEEIIISAGGSCVKINGSGVTNSTSGSWTAQASMHLMPGPAKNAYVMPHLPKGELSQTELEFRHLTDWGVPLAGAAYKATLSDGSVHSGTLDDQGVARISAVPAGTAAKIEYDYKPMQVSSTVVTEMHHDVHELLNWPVNDATDEGDA